MKSNKINYDPAQALFVKHLSNVQTQIEEYEFHWEKYKNLINLRTQSTKKSEKNQPKYSKPKPKQGIFKSFLIENISLETQIQEENEGNKIL